MNALASIDARPRAAVTARDVLKRFGDVEVLTDVYLDIAEGEFVALLGASGSGKTTLLRILAGLDVATSGDVWVPTVRTVVFQEPRLVPSKRVWRNVVIGQSRSAGTRRAAEQALHEVGLADKATAWPATLSGGQAQRVALARALVREPALLLLDEPFAALDALTRLRMHELLHELRARHAPATLLVTHDVDEAIVLADRIAVLVDGRLTHWTAIDDEAQRRRGSAAFDATRTALLAHLGVDIAESTGPLRGPPQGSGAA